MGTDGWLVGQCRAHRAGGNGDTDFSTGGLPERAYGSRQIDCLTRVLKANTYSATIFLYEFNSLSRKGFHETRDVVANRKVSTSLEICDCLP